ncbi:MAG: PAS domain S-box protein [Desulfobacterales bacterium]|nr:PAS domain S-box protein [Desulfobacterales bacterium]
MLKRIIPRSFLIKITLAMGATLFVSLTLWAAINISHQRNKAVITTMTDTDRLTNIIKLGTHYAMLHNLRDDINQVIKKTDKEAFVETIRIYNKQGHIKFSNKNTEIDETISIDSEACHICHKYDPVPSRLSLREKTRIFYSPEGYRLLGVISPIYSEPGCSACHIHPKEKEVLGLLDLVVSLEDKDRELSVFEKRVVIYTVSVFMLISIITFYFILRFIKVPISKIIEGTRLIAEGNYSAEISVGHNDEMNQLSLAISQMGRRIGEKQAELNKQRDEYQTLFERVPCFITVQDRNYKLLRYNREFSEKFNPEPGDYCFHAYKNRQKKCEVCPVEKTFEDGMPHVSEEKGIKKDGTLSHWIVKTSPLKDETGQVTAAMEMNLDITQLKLLEDKLKKSEKKYYAIFNNIPNAVFVADRDTLEILDCNESVKSIYGYEKGDIIGRPILILFRDDEKQQYEFLIKNTSIITKAANLMKSGDIIFTSARISPSEYPGRKVLLVTASDITKRLETEQQLIQASKMTTLGEMATGIAHELNQPLTVIKTASSFLMKKSRNNEPIKDDILLTMTQEIDTHVDRAAKIINHMRQFGRKSDLELEMVQVNEVLKRASEILGQQLRLRGIGIVFDTDEDLPMIMADPIRLEQVFINLLINARDAVEDKKKFREHLKNEDKITIETGAESGKVVVKISDTGHGISEANLNKIFEPFFTTKEVGYGTGLGLSISYGIIKDCKGTIRAFSEEGKGACFVTEFPIQNET